MFNANFNEAQRTNNQVDNFASKKQAIISGIQKDLHPQNEVKPIASRKYIEDSEKIVDVEFADNGKSVRLKEIMPGNYSFVITHFTKKEVDERPSLIANHQPDTGVITINEGGFEKESDINLSILHEAGHNLDHISSFDSYHDLQRKKCTTFLQMMAHGEARNYKELEMRQPEEKMKAMLNWKKQIKQYSRWFKPEEIVEIENEYQQFCIELLKQQDQKQIVTRFLELNREYGEADLIIKIREERGAWANALRAMRKFEDMGINIIGFDQKDTIKSVEAALATKESGYLDYIKIGKGFLHRLHPVHHMYDEDQVKT